jgi:hypothetical protein
MKIIIVLIIIKFILNLRQDKKRRKTTGENIGTTLYSGQVVTQAMKRPQKWFFNVMIKKPNEKYFREAEYNGLRYQTELLENNLEREYNGYVRDFYDEKLNVEEQKLLATVKVRKDIMSKLKK